MGGSGLPLGLAGIILLVAGQSWFTGAATVGWILTGLFVFFPLAILLVALIIAMIVAVAR